MRLHYREYGTYADGRPTLVFLHGLLGSSSNWHSIARAFEPDHHVLVPDLRNHGRSPHHPDVGYRALEEDLERFLDDQGLDRAVLVGHSMGGKAAMVFALEQPDTVTALVVVDIAPVVYHSRLDELFDLLLAVDLSVVDSRETADRLLARSLDDRRLRNYLLQNLQVSEGRWTWRFNVEALARGLGEVLAFPVRSRGAQYPGPALFLYGTGSDYVQPAFEPAIRAFFPYARLRPVAGAGHWVYAEQPGVFVDALRRFLSRELA